MLSGIVASKALPTKSEGCFALPKGIFIGLYVLFTQKQVQICQSMTVEGDSRTVFQQRMTSDGAQPGKDMRTRIVATELPPKC
jgi:hypothetical protein